MPLLGAIGNASKYSFRGTYDNYPFDIDFQDLVDVEPGKIYTTSLKLVDGINYKVPISISGDGEYYVGNVTFNKTFDNNFIGFDQTATTFDSTFPELDYSTLPTYIRNGNTIGLRIFGVPIKKIGDNITIIDSSSTEYTISLSSPITIETRDGDYIFNPNNAIQVDDRGFQGESNEVGIEYYGKTYSTTVTIGKREFTWTVSTKKGEISKNFSFADANDVQFSTEVVSDHYIVEGLSDPLSYTAIITSNEGLLSVNYGNFVKSSSVKNGDLVRLKVTSSSLNFTQKTVDARIFFDESPEIQVNTSWNVRTLDNIPSNLSFADVLSAELNAEVLSEVVKIDGLTNNIDFNVEIVSPDDASLIINPGSGDQSTVSTIISIDGSDGSSISLDPSQLVEYGEFDPGIEYTLKSNANVVVELYAVGGGGGGSGYRNIPGSSGGLSRGLFTLKSGVEYKLIVGEAGGDGELIDNNGTALGGFPGGGNAPSANTSLNRSGGGGGYTGLFITSVAQTNAIIIAGGGGGSSGDPASGGSGGGKTGGNSENAGERGGSGASQSAGGLGGAGGESGLALQGGNGVSTVNGSAGGGGGYFGGGGGGSLGPGAGGGGSGFLHPTLLSNATTQTGGGNNVEGNGSFKIIFQSVSNPSPFVKSATIRNGDNLQLKLNTTGNWLEEKTVTVKLENTSSNWKVTNRTIAANTDPNAGQLIYSIPFNTINQIQDMSPEVRLKSSLSEGLRASTVIGTVAGRTSPAISTEQSKFYGNIGSYKLAKGTTTGTFEVTQLRINTDQTQVLGFDDFTAEMWVWFNGLNFGGEVGMSIFYSSYIDSRNANDYFFQLFLKGDNWINQPQFRRGILLGYPDANGVVQTICETSSQVLLNNTWNHIALTRSGSTFRIWVNGTNWASGSRSMDLTSRSYNFAIPNFQKLIPEDFYIQDLRLYKGIAKYTSNFNPSSVTSIMEPYTP